MTTLADKFDFWADTANDYFSLYCKKCGKGIQIPRTMSNKEILIKLNLHLKQCGKEIFN